jgi:hypothetical protein
MPITSDLGGKNYTLGRGRVFIDRFAANAVVTALTKGDGERYLGNTPEFTMTSESEDLEHFDSDSGVRVKDGAVQLTLNRSGAFTCDNISAENIALYFLGENSTVTQLSALAVQETFTAGVKRGRFYQIGVSEVRPAGVRGIANVLVHTGAGFSTLVTATGNYEVDEARGRILILNGAPGIPENAVIRVTCDYLANTREQVVSKSSSIYASIRFVADNPTGANRDFFLPYVKLAPDGDYNLKGDEWQTMGFTMEILKKASNVDALYIDGQPA